MPLVSVVMASYNHEEYVSAAIESVLGQTFTGFELIVVDDASKDRSRDIIKSYQERDHRVRTFFHDQNQGIGRTFNEGIERAQASFLAFIASDDLWTKNKLEKQLEVLCEDPNLIVWSEGSIIRADGNSTGRFFTQNIGAAKKKKSGDIFEELLARNFIFGSSLILNRENLGEIRFCEGLKYLNDYQFEVDLARKYNYHFIAEPLAMYRIHGRNSILGDRVGRLSDSIIIGHYFLRKYGSEISSSVNGKILYSIGLNHCWLGDLRTGRVHLLKAITRYPFNVKALIAIYLSLFGPAGFKAAGAYYEGLRSCKKKYF